MQLDCGTSAGVLAAGHTVFRHHHQFARQHVALVLGAQQIEGAGLRGEHNRVGPVWILDAPHRKRPEAARIARGKDAVARHHHDRESAFDLAQRVGNRIDERAGLRVRNQLHDDFGVGRGLEVSAVALQPCAHVAQIHQVAVVRDRDQALGRVHADRLRIQAAPSRRSSNSACDQSPSAPAVSAAHHR